MTKNDEGKDLNIDASNDIKVTETIEVYSDFFKTQEAIEARKKERKQKASYLLAFFITLYVFVAAFFASSYLNSKLKNKPTNDLLSQLQEQRDEIKELKLTVSDLLAQINATTTGNRNINLIQTRLTTLEKNYERISESITFDADRALTTTLLRERQTELKEDVQRTNFEIEKINDTLDKILWSVFILPIIGLVGYFFREEILKKFLK